MQDIKQRLVDIITKLSDRADKYKQEREKGEAFKQFQTQTAKAVDAGLSAHPELKVETVFSPNSKSKITYAIKVPDSIGVSPIAFELPDDSLTKTDFSSPQFVSQIEMAQNKLVEILSNIDFEDGIRGIKFILNTDGTVDFRYGKNDVQKLGANDIIPIEENSEIDDIESSDLMELIKSMPQASDCDFEVQGSTVIVSYTYKFDQNTQRNVKMSIPEELFEGEYEDNSRIAQFLKNVVGNKIITSITKPTDVEVNIVINPDWSISL